MKKAGWPRLISMAVPYIAVFIGLYVLKNAWVALGLYHLGIAMFLVADGRGKLLRKIRSGWNPVAVAACAIVCALIGPAIFILWQYMQLGDVCLKVTLMNFGLNGLSWYVFIIYFSTVQPFLEELYWRGYLESNHKYLSWTDLAFAGYHVFVLAWFIKLPWLVVSFVVLSIAASAWRYIAHRFGGLAVPLFSHLLADISIIAVTNVLIW